MPGMRNKPAVESMREERKPLQTSLLTGYLNQLHQILHQRWDRKSSPGSKRLKRIPYSKPRY